MQLWHHDPRSKPSRTLAASYLWWWDAGRGSSNSVAVFVCDWGRLPQNTYEKAIANGLLINATLQPSLRPGVLCQQLSVVENLSFDWEGGGRRNWEQHIIPVLVVVRGLECQ